MEAGTETSKCVSEFIEELELTIHILNPENLLFKERLADYAGMQEAERRQAYEQLLAKWLKNLEALLAENYSERH
jgi:hypothetical protein